MSSNAIWILENAKANRGGGVKFGVPYRFRHAATNSYLTIMFHPHLANTYCLAVSSNPSASVGPQSLFMLHPLDSDTITLTTTTPVQIKHDATGLFVKRPQVYFTALAFWAQGAHVLHKGGGCAPRAGRCPPRGWQQGRDQPTAHGTVDVVRRCEILVQGGRRVGQEGVRCRGTQERQQTGEGATQTHRTREPHQEGKGRAQQTRRRGTARQERQPEQREQGTRMERMGECAHGRQRQ